MQNIVFLQHKELKTGVHTEHYVKCDMMKNMRRMLERPSLFFARDFVCVGKVAGSPLPAGDAGNVARVKDALQKQAVSYCELREAAKTPHGRVVVKYTGKVAVGSKDDLITALQLNLYWKDTLFYGDAKYAAFR